MRATLRGAGLWSVTAIAGCLSADPNHCANRGGDAACAELGFAQYCSICEHVEAGCVAQMPSPDCYHAGEPVATDDGSEVSTSSSGEDETTGPPPACSTTGLDPDCPAANPYCIGGTCGPCGNGDADFCASVDEATPVCHPDWGYCVGCMVNADCEEGFCSPQLSCGGCFRHDQCPDTACDLATGECMPMSARIWVDDNGAGCGPPGMPSADPGKGEEGDPYCWIGTAIANVPNNGVGAIILAGGSTPIHEEVRVTTPKSIALMGMPPARIGDVDVPLTVGGIGANVYLESVDFTRAGVVAIDCTLKGSVWMDGTIFTEMDQAIAASNCEIVMRRAEVQGLVSDAVVAVASTVLRMEASVVAAGPETTPGAVGVRTQGAVLDVRYSTLLGGEDASVRALACDDTSSGTVRNSVLAGVGGDSVGCVAAEFVTNVVDTSGLGETNVLFDQLEPLWFTDLSEFDVHLDLTAPFGDVAVWDLGDPVFDLDDKRRMPYPGVTEYAGADQP